MQLVEDRRTDAPLYRVGILTSKMSDNDRYVRGSSDVQQRPQKKRMLTSCWLSSDCWREDDDCCCEIDCWLSTDCCCEGDCLLSIDCWREGDCWLSNGCPTAVQRAGIFTSILKLWLMQYKIFVFLSFLSFLNIACINRFLTNLLSGYIPAGQCTVHWITYQLCRRERKVGCQGPQPPQRQALSPHALPPPH